MTVVTLPLREITLNITLWHCFDITCLNISHDEQECLTFILILCACATNKSTLNYDAWSQFKCSILEKVTIHATQS